MCRIIDVPSARANPIQFLHMVCPTIRSQGCSSDGGCSSMACWYVAATTGSLLTVSERSNAGSTNSHVNSVPSVSCNVSDTETVSKRFRTADSMQYLLFGRSSIRPAWSFNCRKMSLKAEPEHLADASRRKNSALDSLGRGLLRSMLQASTSTFEGHGGA